MSKSPARHTSGDRGHEYMWSSTLHCMYLVKMRYIKLGRSQFLKRARDRTMLPYQPKTDYGWRRGWQNSWRQIISLTLPIRVLPLLDTIRKRKFPSDLTTWDQ